MVLQFIKEGENEVRILCLRKKEGEDTYFFKSAELFDCNYSDDHIHCLILKRKEIINLLTGLIFHDYFNVNFSDNRNRIIFKNAMLKAYEEFLKNER